MTGDPCKPRFGVLGYTHEGEIWFRSGWRVVTGGTGGSARLHAPDGRRISRGSEDECIKAGIRLAPAETSRKAVVLLHGMGRTPRMMNALGAALRKRGFTVANIGYPSLRSALPSLAVRLRRVISGLADGGAEEIHIVGHSLGGLLARLALSEPFPGSDRVVRIVTHGTPHTGASLADGLFSLLPRIFGLAAGPNSEWVTTAGAAAVPVPQGVEFGIIAGGTGKRGFNPMLKGDNDFVVTVAETRLPGGEKDFIRIRGLHSFLPETSEGIRQTLSFLAEGRFDRSG